MSCMSMYINSTGLLPPAPNAQQISLQDMPTALHSCAGDCFSCQPWALSPGQQEVRVHFMLSEALIHDCEGGYHWQANGLKCIL